MATRLIRGLYNTPEAAKGCVLTIGNFDGVHLGHQALIAETKHQAAAFQVASLVLTFEPHPHEFFEGNKTELTRLSRFREKCLALQAAKVDYVLILAFNNKLSHLTADEFLKLLIKHLKPKAIVVGDDFRFGFKREGDTALLKKAGRVFGFNVTCLSTQSVAGQRISSTRIRAALKDGDLVLARQLLGHSYTMHGRVRRGDQLGRQLGFPTLNISLAATTPLQGIFAVKVYGIEAEPFYGAASIGTRPTVGGQQMLLEVHVLDFAKERYGYAVTVEFCKKLREEKCFANLEELKQQIAKDIIATRKYFNLR